MKRNPPLTHRPNAPTIMGFSALKGSDIPLLVSAMGLLSGGGLVRKISCLNGHIEENGNKTIPNLEWGCGHAEQDGI